MNIEWGSVTSQLPAYFFRSILDAQSSSWWEFYVCRHQHWCCHWGKIDLNKSLSFYLQIILEIQRLGCKAACSERLSRCYLTFPPCWSVPQKPIFLLYKNKKRHDTQNFLLLLLEHFSISSRCPLILYNYFLSTSS